MISSIVAGIVLTSYAPLPPKEIRPVSMDPQFAASVGPNPSVVTEGQPFFVALAIRGEKDTYEWRWVGTTDWYPMFASGGCPQIDGSLQSNPDNSGTYTTNGSDYENGNWDITHTVVAMNVDVEYVIKTDTYTFTDTNVVAAVKDQTITLQHQVRINNS